MSKEILSACWILRLREPAVLSPQPDSVAAQAGIQRGDKVISLNGETVSYDNFIGLIQKYKENPIKIVVVRNNQPQNITLQPKINEDGKALIGTNVQQSKFRQRSRLGFGKLPRLPLIQIWKLFV